MKEALGGDVISHQAKKFDYIANNESIEENKGELNILLDQ